VVLAFCLIALVFGAEQQQPCRSCTTNTCSAPWPTLSGSCVNGEWTYTGPVTLEGTVTISCPIRVNGALNFKTGTTLSIGSCGRIGVEAFNAPATGINVIMDLGGAAATVGTSRTFATFRTYTGYVNSAEVRQVAVGPDFTFYGEFANNEAVIKFVPPGTLPPPIAPDPAAADPNFAANGDRIRQCPKFNCNTPSNCNDPTGGQGTCDTVSGEWVIPNDVTIATANLSCPIRIQGNFRATNALQIGGCAKIRVTGVAVLTGATDNDLVSVVFDLNNFGKPVAGERIDWLSAEGGILGGLSRISYTNIWDLQNTVNPQHQRCGNMMSVHFYPANGVRPAENCNGNTVTANAVVDDFVADVEFANVAGDFAFTDDLANVVGDVDPNLGGDFAVTDNVIGDVDPNLGGDFAFTDDLANVVGDVDPNLGGDFAVTDNVIGDVDPNLGGDFAVTDDFANLGDVDANLAGDFDPNLDFAFIDEFGNVAGDDGFGDFMVMDAAVDGGNSASGSSNSAIPAYAVALIVLSVLLVLGLIVIQVQIVLLRRARANNRLRQEEVI